MAYHYLNLTQEEDFWKDVAEDPKRSTMRKNTSGLHFKALNSKRMKKFEELMVKYRKEPIVKPPEAVSHKKLIEKIDRMLQLGKRNSENRFRVYEQRLKEKEIIEVSKCTFHPDLLNAQSQMKNFPDQTKALASTEKIRNCCYYEKSQKWSRNLQGKKEKMRQKLHLLNSSECLFTPQINQSSIESVFNKAESEMFLPQNANFLRTQADNRRKRYTSQLHFTHSVEKKVKTSSTSRSMSFFCSIEALKNELRHTCADFKEEATVE